MVLVVVVELVAVAQVALQETLAMQAQQILAVVAVVHLVAHHIQQHSLVVMVVAVLLFCVQPILYLKQSQQVHLL